MTKRLLACVATACLAACGSKARDGRAPADSEAASETTSEAPSESNRATTSSAAAPAQALPLVARRLVPVAGKPIALGVPDRDGDGRDGLYVTTLVTREVRELALGPGGAWADARTPWPTGGWPLAPALAAPGTFGDGSPATLVLASREDNAIRLFARSADGAPLGARTWRTGSVGLEERPRVIAAGSLTALGGPSLFLATDRDRVLWRGAAPEPIEQLQHGDALPSCAVILADGSGVVVGFQRSRHLRYFRPGEPEAAWSLELSGFARALAELDLDGDGDLELVAVGGDRSLWVAGLGRAGGSAAWLEQDAPPAELEIGAIPIRFDARDLDGDGAMELAVLHAYELSVHLLGGWSAGGPAWRRVLHVGQTPSDLAFGDFDADGHVDLAVANRDSDAVSVMHGEAGGTFGVGHSVHVGRFPNAIAAGKLAGDAGAEVVTLNSKDDTLAIVSFSGDEPRRLLATKIGSEPRAPQVVDVDGDGHRDVAALVTENGETHMVVLYGAEAGSWSEPKRLGEAALATQGVAQLWLPHTGAGARFVLADASRNVLVNGRVLADGGRGEARIELDEAVATAPGPAAIAALPTGASGPRVAVSFDGERPGWALFQIDGGNAQQRGEVSFHPTAEAAIDLVSADFDADGRADVAVLISSPHSFSGSVQVFLGSDAEPAGFRALEPLPTGLQPHHIEAGDVDGDGRAELFVSAQNSHVVNSYRLGSDGRLQRLADLGAGRGVLDVALADLDGDGDLDLAVANAFSDDVTWIENRP